MRFTTASTAIAFASSVAQVQAYFLVASHITGFGGPVGQTGNTWIMSPDLDCSTLNDQNIVPSKPDVSSAEGVRVKWGSGDCKSTWLRDDCPVEVEQHFPDRHQSE